MQSIQEKYDDLDCKQQHYVLLQEDDKFAYETGTICDRKTAFNEEVFYVPAFNNFKSKKKCLQLTTILNTTGERVHSR